MTLRSLPFQAHSATSRAAAKSTLPAAGTQRRKVLDFVRTYGPVTDEEIQDGLGMNQSTQRPRRVELCNDGLIKADGEKQTKSGRKATTWCVK
jgi:transcription initiation factor IIE alpha subunit